MKMKTCGKCGERKTVLGFYKNRSAHDGLQSHCKMCQSTRHHRWTEEQKQAHYRRTAEWKRKNPEKATEIRRKAHLKRLYGISPEEYDRLFDEQDGCCAVCARPAEGRKRPLAVDHDHETGEVRGLLCDACNLGIGCLQESQEILERAMSYLQREAVAA